MKKRMRIVCWTVLFLGLGISVTPSVTPWETSHLRICRDCLVREHTITGFLSLTETTSVTGSDFADWFESQNPNHQHVWWNLARSERGLSQLRSNYGRGQFGRISPETVLSLAKSSPSDYERYRQMVLSREISINNEAVWFSYEAERQLERVNAPVK